MVLSRSHEVEVMRGPMGSQRQVAFHSNKSPEPRPKFLSWSNPNNPPNFLALDMARPKQKTPNPISAAVKEWLVQSYPHLPAVKSTEAETLIVEAPKRWVTYEPMVLLPSGSFTSPTWKETMAKISNECRDDLWKSILRQIGSKTAEKTTHLAVNDGIPLTVAAHPGPEDAAQSRDKHGEENTLRSPIGLRTLYGDFGPDTVRSCGAVSDGDLDAAFWTSTKQNGIYQTWAPRWTMFSRGNVKEKARLLAFHDLQPRAAGDEEPRPLLQHRARPRAALKGAWAVDLYAGIGYFVFSYARLGLRVLCWELNPWSVEGLRRGARANGWSVRVVQGEDLARPTRELVPGEEDEGEDGADIVVFLEDNQQAARRVGELRSRGFGLPVAHVNCGLLPRSDGSWEAARDIIRGGGREGWAHLHENVGARDVERRRHEIQGLLDGLDRRDGAHPTAEVEHVELVKTFAPDVWHCVFDVYITRSSDKSSPR